MKDHATLAEVFIKDEPRTDWHDETLWFVRQKRDKAAHGLPEWEQLREWASQIKNHTLSNMDRYLEEFERNAQANGVKVDNLLQKTVEQLGQKMLSQPIKRMHVE